MSLDVYDWHLANPGSRLHAVTADGARLDLPSQRWMGSLSRADSALLSLVTGPTLDVGCGPGRLTAALTARGVRVLGIDISGQAVATSRSTGADARQVCVFGDVPDPGDWDTVILADGNIGIGGNPTRLLERVHRLLRPGGRVLVELDQRDAAAGEREILRLVTSEGHVGSWFPWARLGRQALTDIAGQVGFRCVLAWSCCERGAGTRRFAMLRKR